MPEFSPIADDLDARTRAAITILRTALVAQLNGLTKEEWKESTEKSIIKAARLFDFVTDEGEV